jgi:NAD(P)-dependent dehydrogenase (short-subunit alcohol dehydrogenase family)
MSLVDSKRSSVVVGGTRGIGRAVVKSLFARGDDVTAIARRRPLDRERIDGVIYRQCDVVDLREVECVLGEIKERTGEVSSLVLSQRFRSEDDDWEGEMATVLKAAKCIIDLFTGIFSRDASIVIVGSPAGKWVAQEQSLAYHVSRAGLEQLVRYYAVSLGTKGVRVNTVMAATIVKDESQSYFQQHQDLQDFYAKTGVLGRMGTADEIASVVKFLCSPDASFLTGQSILVDGGASLRWPESLIRESDTGAAN